MGNNNIPINEGYSDLPDTARIFKILVKNYIIKLLTIMKLNFIISFWILLLSLLRVTLATVTQMMPYIMHSAVNIEALYVSNTTTKAKFKEDPKRMHPEFVMLNFTNINSVIVVKEIKSQTARTVKSAAFVVNPFMRNGVTTIHINLSMAISNLDVRDISMDVRHSPPHNRQRTESFQYKEIKLASPS